MSAKQLRAWRKKRGFTQKEAAAHLGYSERHYQRFEGGKALLPDPKEARDHLRRIELAVEKLAE